MKNYSYNKIAYDYHLKRKKPWKPLQQFLDYLNNRGYKFNGNCIDLGCGNGRNFKIFISFPDVKIIGIDNSLEFLKIARNRLQNPNHFSKIEQNSVQLILGDLKCLPIRDNSVQNIFSIASIHHIEKNLEREKVINHIYNILEKKGKFLLTVWRRWQKKFRFFFIKDWISRKFNPKYNALQKKKGLYEFGDKFVPWTVSNKGIKYQRFYHFFSKREIKKLLKIFKIEELCIMGGPTNKDNIFMLTQKV
ncbi:MAG: class I SAM-dependent methyltransferase [Promethearchaeota archaeon]|nr:MAG: class I SAM-dependent methyltransferase [Candidatus Lokiarchaeota archaeon]